MPFLGRSLLDTRTLSRTEVEAIFSRAELLARSLHDGAFRAMRAPVVCCLFFEPSTRTRMSFQMASYRLGLEVLTMELSAGSSLSKGETLSDTVLNFAAMKPDVLVVRYGQSTELDELLPHLGIPVINAGSGTMAHPTQGLLDSYTLQREWGALGGKRVLIFGDVRHSRVARSNFDLLSRLGAEVGACGPAPMLPSPEQMPGVRVFETLEEALPWADACMGLRIQLERHASKELDVSAASEYHARYGLNSQRLALLRPDALILHPGPINYGLEFSSEVIRDGRSRVLAQVANGVVIRAALLSLILGLEVGT